MNKNQLINYLKNNVDINIYSIKGGVSKFNKEHPNILKYINKYTNDIMKYSLNKNLSAKLVFLTKYCGDIKLITKNNNLMIFDKILRDFKIANQNSAKKQWDRYKFELLKIDDVYDKENTINQLKNNYKNYFGKSGNRKLLKENKKLYLSLYYHTKNMDNLNINLKKFSMRLIILINNYNIICPIHNKLKFWKFNSGEFTIICNECEPKYPSIQWFKHKYGDEWEFYFDNRINKLKEIRTNSLKWYKNKYGDVIGEFEYEKSVINKINMLIKLKGNRYSKISQELFWNIYNKLNDKSKIFFHELNHEYVIKIPKKYSYHRTVMIVDFIKENKIIEYNGIYWHNDKDDEIRNNILNDLGYEVLYITSDEYNKNKKDTSIVDKCIKYLTC